MYDLVKYGSYFLAAIIWILWLVGLFYGKIVVVDFVVALQIILLCSITTGPLSPGFSGMMLSNFVFYSFTGIFTQDY